MDLSKLSNEELISLTETIMCSRMVHDILDCEKIEKEFNIRYPNIDLCIYNVLIKRHNKMSLKEYINVVNIIKSLE